MAHRVLYYTLDGDTDRAREMLAQWGMADEIELVGCPHEAVVEPKRVQVKGCEALVGEFAPVGAECAAMLAEEGVKLVASMSIGVNHMDVDALAEHGVVVTTCPGYCAEDVATHAVALMLDLMRKVTFSNRHTIEGSWEPRGGYEIYRTQGRTMGLAFFGRIARQVAPIARALGMKVLVWAPTKSEEELAAAGCEKAGSFEELARRSDVVSLHCPLIPETEGLVGARELSLMKPTAYLVNTARGPLVDEEALADALDASIASGGTEGIRAAGLDVLCDETRPNQRLVHHPRCIVTPHTAYDSLEAADNLRLMSLESVCDVLVRGKLPASVVRPSGGKAATYPWLRS